MKTRTLIVTMLLIGAFSYGWASENAGNEKEGKKRKEAKFKKRQAKLEAKLMKYSGDEGSVNYAKLSALLIKTMQDQKAVIDELQERVDYLETIEDQDLQHMDAASNPEDLILIEEQKQLIEDMQSRIEYLESKDGTDVAIEGDQSELEETVEMQQLLIDEQQERIEYLESLEETVNDLQFDLQEIEFQLDEE